MKICELCVIGGRCSCEKDHGQQEACMVFELHQGVGFARIKELESENAELKKCLECPAVEWKNLTAWIGSWLIGSVDNEDWNEKRPAPEVAYFGVSNVTGYCTGAYCVRRTSKDIAKCAVENAWFEFWNKIHGGSK